MKQSFFKLKTVYIIWIFSVLFHDTKNKNVLIDKQVRKFW